MKRIGMLVAALCCLAVSACATRYQDVDRALPHAALEFRKGYTTGAGFGAGTFQAYVITNAQGLEPELAASFTWTTGDEETRYVAADTPVYVHATTTYSTATGVSSTGYGYYANMSNVHCVGSASFSPVAGQTYRVEQAELSYGVCEMRVVDVATGQAPLDLAVVGNSNAAGTPPADPSAQPSTKPIA